MTSTTKTIAKTLSKAETEKLQASIDAAEAAKTTALEALDEAEAGLTKAKTEAARIDGLIASGDLTYGRNDSTNASEDARFAGLFLQGKNAKVAEADSAVRDSKLDKLTAEIERDGRITSVTATNAAGLALAREIAPLVKAFKETMETHNAARLEAIELAGETNAHDAVSGYGPTDSRVVFGKHNTNRNYTMARATPEFIELDGLPIRELASWDAVDHVLKAIKSLVEHTPEELESTPGLMPFTTVNADGSRPHEWVKPVAV